MSLIITSNNNNPSICIPRVYSSITKKNIIEIFQYKLKFGVIKRIEMIQSNNKNYIKIFIHFHYWNNDDININTIKDKLLLGKVIKIVYDFPSFWKCSLYNPSL